MLEGRVIVDTGPLVAFLVEEDEYHAWAVDQFKCLPCPLLTCEPVLSETFFLIHRFRGGSQGFFELLGSGVIEVGFELMAEQPALAKLARKYSDLPMSLADACLVRMSELTREASVFTIDSHFRIYRRNGRQTIPVIMPPDT